MKTDVSISNKSGTKVSSIYVVRLGLTTYYNYRASTVQSNLNGLQKQRDTAVQKLKAATKYDITQDLLKKYGGTPTPKANSTANASQISNPNPNPATPKESRTSIVPPPTANIPGRNLPASLQNTPEHSTAAAQRLLKQNASFSPTFKAVPRQLSSGFQDGSADFAPNAFSTAPQYVQPGQGSRWYDRIMDVLLGEDEMLPRNRLALICSHCRLVNGQAPPGIKHLGDVGKWRCSGCGTMNGEEIEADKIFANIKEQTISKTGEPKEGTKSNRALRDNGAGNDDAQADHGEETDITQYSEDLDDGSSTSEREKEKVPEPSAEPKPPRRRVGRPRGSGKKQS